MYSDEVSHEGRADGPRLVRFAAAAMALLLLLMFLYAAAKRMRYPFELDRMESAMMTTVWRVAQGMPIYTKPSLEWAPFLYAPVFFYLSALAAKITGVNYAALRLVSTLATVGSCGVIFLLVFRETRRVAVALVSMGLFAGFYGTVMGWYDIGRVDSLSVFFFLLALYCMRFHGWWLAAVVWVLAFQTKQGFLPVGVLAFAVYWQRPRRMLLGIGTYVVLAWLSVRLLNGQTHGWYSYYVFGTVSQLHFKVRLAALYVPFDLLQPLGVAVALACLAWYLHPPAPRSFRTTFYGYLTLLIVAGIGYARAHEGGYVNVLIPMYAWMAVIFGMSVYRLLQWAEAQGRDGGVTPAVLSTVVWALALTQLAMHLYRPGEYTSQGGGLPARKAFLEELRAMPGDVWVVNHSWDSIVAGKGMHAEMDALDAVLIRGDEATIAEVKQAYATHRFTAVILDRGTETYKPDWLFGGEQFAAQYPTEALAPGAALQTSGDQPVIVFLPCAADGDALARLKLDRTYVKQGDCRH